MVFTLLEPFMRFHQVVQGLSIPAAPITDSAVHNPKFKLRDRINGFAALGIAWIPVRGSG
jgi:hypothetical protein